MDTGELEARLERDVRNAMEDAVAAGLHVDKADLIVARMVGTDALSAVLARRTHRMGALLRASERTATCARCSSDLDTAGKCTDVTCPFSDHKQSCPVGWVGHPERPQCDEGTVCTCKSESNRKA